MQLARRSSAAGTQPRESPPVGRFPCFDGMRAVAALAVVVTHAAYRSNAAQGAIGAYLSQFSLAVGLFFGISGFLLYRPFVLAHLSRAPRVGLRGYFVRRATRIYPAYWVALIVTCYVFGQSQFVSTSRAVWGFALVHTYNRELFEGIRQSWTLCVEVSFYVFLPVYAFALRGLGRLWHDRRGLLATELFGVAAIAGVGIWCQAWTVWGSPPIGVGVLPANLALFSGGMLLAVASAWRATTGGLAWTERVAKWPGLWWALAAAGLVFLIEVVDIQAAGGMSRAQTIGRYMLEVVITSCMLVPAAFGPQDRGLVRRFLRTRVMAYLGVISYGIYLWHDSLMQIIHDDVLNWGPNHGSLLQLTAMTLVPTIAIATVSWYLIERPVLRWGRRVGGGTRTGEAASGAPALAAFEVPAEPDAAAGTSSSVPPAPGAVGVEARPT